MQTEHELRQTILKIGKLLHERQLVAASDGNISIRLGDGRILTTPTSMSKGMMEAEDLVITDANGKKLSGRRNASSELAMHLLIYKLRPEVNGVVHAHPPVSTGFAAAGLPLNQALLAEVVLALGCVPLAPYGTTGTPELSDALRPLIPQFDAILMANHGVVTYAEDVMRAYFKMETVEHFAKIALVTHQLGRQVLLGPQEVEKLMEARRRYEGITTAANPMVGCPVTAPAGGASDDPAAQRFWVTEKELAEMVERAVARLTQH